VAITIEYVKYYHKAYSLPRGQYSRNIILLFCTQSTCVYKE